MFIKEFCEAYENMDEKVRDRYIKDTLVILPYLPFVDKLSLTERVVKSTTYEKDSEGKNTGNIKINSPARILLFGMSIIDKYTNLDVDFDNIMVEYDLLQQNGLFAKINSLIPETELAELQGLLDMEFSDLLQNKLSTQSFVSGQVERFSTLIGITLKPVIEKLTTELENLDDSKVEKITKALERGLKKVK